MKRSNVDVEMKTAALLAIAARHGNVLSPAAVVDAARDPTHPLHGDFEWDDTEAAELYRLSQAGALIRRVKVHVLVREQESGKVSLHVTRGLQSRPSMRHRDNGYEPLDVIMSDHDKRDELIASVLRELQAYRKRYASLVALSEVWAAIDLVTAEHGEILRRRDQEGEQPAA